MARDVDNWIGDKVYSATHQSQEVVHSFELREIFDKKRVAQQIGELMIADGCIRVDSDYDIEGMVHRYYFIARPFSKEKRLP